MQESTMPTDFNEQIENSLRDLLEKVCWINKTCCYTEIFFDRF